jgi:hypothetical protein
MTPYHKSLLHLANHTSKAEKQGAGFLASCLPQAAIGLANVAHTLATYNVPWGA